MSGPGRGVPATVRAPVSSGGKLYGPGNLVVVAVAVASSSHADAGGTSPTVRGSPKIIVKPRIPIVAIVLLVLLVLLVVVPVTVWGPGKLSSLSVDSEACGPGPRPGRGHGDPGRPSRSAGGAPSQPEAQ
eukprot:3400150-Rhodomonas_salina.1